jgi:hypothetical protein
VFGHGHERHVERLREVAHRRLAGGKPRDDRPPRGIGERGEDGVERALLTLNHPV